VNYITGRCTISREFFRPQQKSPSRDLLFLAHWQSKRFAAKAVRAIREVHEEIFEKMTNGESKPSDGHTVCQRIALQEHDFPADFTAFLGLPEKWHEQKWRNLTIA
jgi:hypothetical protein